MMGDKLMSDNATDKPRGKLYNDSEVEDFLKLNLPCWRLEKGWIRRKYRTHGWKGTLMVVNAVGHLAEAAWHHPDITASYAWVEVRLMTHSAKGITNKDFELAKKIEDVIHWQPAKEGGALEGTPPRGGPLHLHKIRRSLLKGQNRDQSEPCMTASVRSLIYPPETSACYRYSRA